MKKIVKMPELYCTLLLAVALFLVLASQARVGNVVLDQNGGKREVSLPFSEKMREHARFKVSFDVVQKMNVPFEMKVIPDDCAEVVSINGNRVPLNETNGRCDYTKGFLLTSEIISKFRNGQTTHFEFELRNGGGPAGITVFPKQQSSAYIVLKYLAMALFAVFCVLLAFRLKLTKTLCFFVLMGALLRCFFFAATPYTTYSNDVDGHVSYVQFVLEKHAIPGVDDCWTCYHPPVYYVASSPSFVLGEWLGISGTSGLQVFSLLLSVATLFFGLLFLRSFLSGGALNIASLLWIFWPLMILVSPRIGNDQMFYMMHVLCLWSGANYLKEGRGKYLIVAVVVTALAIWTKTTGVVTLGTLLLFALCGYVMNARSLKPTKSEVVAWVLLLLLLVGVVLQKLLGEADLVGNASGLNSRLGVGNEAFNYIFFDLKSYMTHPYTSAWNTEWGREFFWNYSFKSAMFGEFELVRTPVGRTLATLMSACFLGLVVYAARGFWKTRLNVMHWILLLQTMAFFAALMVLRIKVPFACSNDFRYIAPAVLGFVPFVGLGIFTKNGSTKWKVLGFGLVLGFVFCTAVLYILATKS